MKKTLIGIILLIMVSSLLISCVENVPENDTPSDVTHEVTIPAETTKEVQTTEIVETTESEETTAPETEKQMNIVDVEELRFDIGIGGFNLMYEMYEKHGYTNGPHYTENLKRIIINDAIIEVSLVNYDYYNSYLNMHSISAYGHTKKFNKPILLGSTNVIANQADDLFAVTLSEYYGGYTYIFTKDGIIVIPGPDSEKIEKEYSTFYNESMYVYYVDEAGRLTYSRSPYKYTIIGIESSAHLKYCCGLDELACEEGYVTIEEGKVVYNPEEKYTAEKWLSGKTNIERDFFNQKDIKKETDATTLEELIEYNKAHYEAYS